MSVKPPPPTPDAFDSAKAGVSILSDDKLVARFTALLQQATDIKVKDIDRLDARSKCLSMFAQVLSAFDASKALWVRPEPRATGTDADLRRIAEGGLAHQVRSAAKVVFRDTPGVDAHALEHGDPCLWVGAMAATIVELRQRLYVAEATAHRLLPPAAPRLIREEPV